jgi:hypothetical protein
MFENNGYGEDTKKTSEHAENNVYVHMYVHLYVCICMFGAHNALYPPKAIGELVTVVMVVVVVLRMS